jgi:hypothetical protein
MQDIPVIKVEGKTLPEVWEKAVLATWKDGLSIKTEYVSRKTRRAKTAP